MDSKLIKAMSDVEEKRKSNQQIEISRRTELLAAFIVLTDNYIDKEEKKRPEGRRRIIKKDTRFFS